MSLTAAALVVGRVYSAKRPAARGMYLNDRQVTWLGSTEVQFVTPEIPNDGRSGARVMIEKFLAWADEDVTGQMPADGSWRPA